MPLRLRPEGLPGYVHSLLLEAIGVSGYPVVVLNLHFHALRIGVPSEG